MHIFAVDSRFPQRSHARDIVSYMKPDILAVGREAHKTGKAIAGQNLFRIAAIRLGNMDLTPADQRNLSIRSPGAVVSAWNQLSRRAGRNWHDPQVAPVFSFLTTGHQQLGLFGSNGQYVPSRCG